MSFFPAHSAVIGKIKNKQALIHLEGVQPQVGSYYKVTDLYGKSRGLMKIKRVGKKKGIGVLKIGRMETNWAIEPMPRRVAFQLLKQQAVKRKQALLKKRRANRKLAEANYSDEQSVGLADYAGGSDDSLDKASQFELKNFKLGFSGYGHFDAIKLIGSDYDLISQGVGYSGRMFVEMFLNQYLKLNIHAGWEKFQSETDDVCDEERRLDCNISIEYATGGLGLKVSLLNQKEFDFWLGVEGNLKYPISYQNEINLTEDSFSGLHGDLGLGLGLDIYVGSLVIPISLSGNIFMPPTPSVIAGSGGLSAGLAWSF